MYGGLTLSETDLYMIWIWSSTFGSDCTYAGGSLKICFTSFSFIADCHDELLLSFLEAVLFYSQ